MEHPEKTHWTEDEDQLERFVLNRLDPVERVRLEQHLRTCEICQHAVREERKLAAGAKRLARDEMKSRIAERTGSLASRQIPWPHVLSIAAIIVVIIGLGLYNKWFLVRETRELALTEEPLLEKSESLTSKEEAQEPQRERPDVILREGEVGKLDQSPPVAARDKDTQSAERDVQTQSGDYRARDAISAGPEAPATRSLTEKKEIGKDDVGSGVEPALAGDYVWVEGNILSPSEHDEVMVKRYDLGREMEKRAAAQAEETKVQTEELSAGSQPVTLTQQPLSTLPAVRQQIQARLGKNTVETLIGRTHQGLNLTLYLDEPVHETELENATIRQVSEDSLVVIVANKRIGYRLPAGWATQQTQK
jgi:hypothetical protein